METTAAEFFLALINIVFLDLILAGDNAIVIGLAARNLPKETQKKQLSTARPELLFFASLPPSSLSGCLTFLGYCLWEACS